jgi:hypothetical protein
VVVQALTFYVDGFLYLALICMGASLVLLVCGATGPGAWAVYALGAVLAVNTKAPGLAYGAVFVAAAGAALLARRRIRGALLAGSLFLLAAATTGYHPYVQNLRGFGHPLYPILGSGGGFSLEAQVAPQRPEGFQDASRAERLLRSVLARSESTPGPARLKLPWSLSREELDGPFVHPDVRKGGFGPLFALGLACALAALAGLGIGPRLGVALRRWSLPCVLAASALIHPDGWWARYAPQLWLLPVTAAAFPLAGPRSWPRRLAFAALIVLAIDVALVAEVNLGHNLWESRRMRRQLERARKLPEACFAIRGDFFGARARLRELGIPARLVAEDTCEPSLLLGHYTRLCRACPPPAGSG